jgi:hypothetical protein
MRVMIIPSDVKGTVPFRSIRTSRVTGPIVLSKISSCHASHVLVSDRFNRSYLFVTAEILEKISTVFFSAPVADEILESWLAWQIIYDLESLSRSMSQNVSC